MSYLTVGGTFFLRGGDPNCFLLEHPSPLAAEDCLYISVSEATDSGVRFSHIYRRSPLYRDYSSQAGFKN